MFEWKYHISIMHRYLTQKPEAIDYDIQAGIILIQQSTLVYLLRSATERSDSLTFTEQILVFHRAGESTVPLKDCSHVCLGAFELDEGEYL